MTNFSDKYLKPDIFTENLTFDQYCEKIPVFYLKHQVPEDVKLSFEVIKSLIVFAYYNHKFADVAFTSALNTFEMAMKFKCKEITAKNPKGFKGKLNFLRTRNYFEANEEILNLYEDWRNQHAHPERYTTAGLMVLDALSNICRLINDMYENISLRKERLALFDEFIEGQKKHGLSWYIENHIEGHVRKVFSLQLVFINNKHPIPQYTLAYVPMFKLGSEVKMFSIIVTNPTFQDGVLTVFSLVGNEKIRFCASKPGTPEGLFFQSWDHEWKRYDKTHLYLNEITRLHSGSFKSTITQFYKME